MFALHQPEFCLHCTSLSLVAGVYLLVWSWILLKPTKLAELFEYSRSDLLQQQHTAISTLNILAGLTDVLLSRGFLQHWHWHMQWGVGTSLVGLLFMVHPQVWRASYPLQSAESSSVFQAGLTERCIHTSLGAMVILGALFMLAERCDAYISCG